MPLEHSASDSAFRNNLAEMIRAGHPKAQALAAAFRNQREHRAFGGAFNPIVPVMPGLSGSPAPGPQPAPLPQPAPQPAPMAPTGGLPRPPMPQPQQFFRQPQGQMPMQQRPMPQMQQRGLSYRPPVWPQRPPMQRGGGLARRDMGGGIPNVDVSFVPEMPQAPEQRPPLADARPPEIIKPPQPQAPQPQQQQSGGGGGGGLGSLMAAIPSIIAMFRNGGGIPHLAGGGDPMGISGSAASPWWTRAEEHTADSGLLSGPTLGRSDQLTTTAPSGAYVLPADVVSHLGDGNTIAGARVWDEILRTLPYGISESGNRGRGLPEARATPHIISAKAAKGGGVQGKGLGHPIPVALSDGEIVVSPRDVLRIGHGNLKLGHKALDHFVLKVRAHHIKTLKGLKPPVGHRKSA